jgi:hypothetical protein
MRVSRFVVGFAVGLLVAITAITAGASRIHLGAGVLVLGILALAMMYGEGSWR